MSRALILDTNAYSDYGRKVKWLDVIPTADRVYLPLIVVGELRSGFRHGKQWRKNEADLHRFMNHPRVSLLTLDFQTTDYYSTIFSDLKKRGIKLPQNDLWIAALALQHGLWFCTSDAHFDHLPQLLRV